MRVRNLAIMIAIYLVVLNLLSYALSYAMSSVSVWFINGFVSWFSTILFAIGGVLVFFGALFGTFIGKIMFYTPFGYAKKRDTTGKDESDNKFTDTGLPLILLGLITIFESVIVGFIITL
jgi:hypothetical protein